MKIILLNLRKQEKLLKMTLKMTGKRYGEYKNLCLEVYWQDVKGVYQQFNYFRERAPHMLAGTNLDEGSMVRECFSALEREVSAAKVDAESMPDEEPVPRWFSEIQSLPDQRYSNW